MSLGQRVDHRVKKIRRVKVGLVAGFLVWDRLQPRRQRLVPLCGERGYVGVHPVHLLNTYFAWKWNRIESGAAYRGVRKQ